MRFAGFLVVLAAAAASAQEEPAPAPVPEETKKPETLLEKRSYPMPDEIVVSAERGVPLTYAGGRDVIEREVMDRYPDANFASVLRRIPGVTVLAENGNDGRINVGIRGNDPRRSGLTAVLVDGIPVCEAPYGNTDVDALPVTFERISRIDVIRGGGSIRWGPNSAGGVVNLITEPVPEKPTFRVSTRYGSHADYSVATSAGGTSEGFGVLVTGVTKGGDGFRENSEYGINDGSLKMRWAINPKDVLSASLSRYTELDAEQPGGLTQADYDEDPDQSTRPGADFRYAANVYSMNFVHEVGEDGAFQIIGWWQDGSRALYDFRPIVAPFTVDRVQASEFSSGALEARYSWAAPILGARNRFFHTARYLVESNREFYYRQPLAGGPIQTPHELDASFKGHAFSSFNEDVVSLRDDLDLAVGGRLESISMGSKSRDPSVSPPVERTQIYSEFLPESSLTWSVRPKTALYGSYQENFFAPQYETGFDPTSAAYNPVEPEHSRTFEAGVRSRDVRALEMSAAVFRTEFRDKIDFVNLSSGSKIAVNTGEALSRGVEMSAAWEAGESVESLKGFSLYGTLTELRSTIESGPNEGNDTPHSPHRLASWGAQYEHRSGLWARIGGSYTASSFKEPANIPTGSADGVSGPEPAYTLWDCALGWRARGDGQGFSVEAGITNLFDERYFRRFVSGIYPGAPRQLFVAASWTVSW